MSQYQQPITFAIGSLFRTLVRIDDGYSKEQEILTALERSLPKNEAMGDLNLTTAERRRDGGSG